MLDALRKQRNLSDYSGDLGPDSTANECVTSARALFAYVEAWLQGNKPELM